MSIHVDMALLDLQYLARVKASLFAYYQRINVLPIQSAVIPLKSISIPLRLHE